VSHDDDSEREPETDRTERPAADRQFTRRAALGLTGGVALSTLLGTSLSDHQEGPPSSPETIRLERVGRYATGEFDGGAEIVAYESAGQRLFVVNSGAGQIEVLDLSDPTDPRQTDVLDAAGDVENGGGANSVDVANGLAAVAVERVDPQQPGAVAFYDTEASPNTIELQNVVEVGALPDKVTLTPDASYAITADEGEPAFDEPAGDRTDPGGSISVVDLTDGVESATVETLGFEAFDDQVERLREEGARVYGASVEDDPRPSTDFEPEFVTVTDDGETAFVSIQENNAIATVDVPNAEITDVSGLGFKDFSIPGNELDTSDADLGEAGDTISLQSWPVKGMYQPDAIAAREIGDETFVFTANEGDARDFEVSTVSELSLSEEAFAPRLSENPFVDSVAGLKRPENLGNLEVTNQLGDEDGDGEFEALYLFGARSFSTFRLTDNGLELVYDSGNEFERRYAEQVPEGFQNQTESGPETESVELGQVGDRTYAFVGIERGSAVFVYDVTVPTNGRYVQTALNRDFSTGFGDLAADAEADPENDTPGRAGDWGPEGVKFVPAADSPIDNPLLCVGYEVSGTVGVFEVRPVAGRRPAGGN
jgi:hypothetical protein